MRQTRNTKLTHLFQTTKFYFFVAISLTVSNSGENFPYCSEKPRSHLLKKEQMASKKQANACV